MKKAGTCDWNVVPDPLLGKSALPSCIQPKKGKPRRHMPVPAQEGPFYARYCQFCGAEVNLIPWEGDNE